ncbi:MULTISPECIES: hypothetical protein [unclassified Sphingomonas]|nr:MULTISPECIES: hypothetical protein [unclassified Sphingomonas]
MNLLTKRGKWSPAPIRSDIPREVRFFLDGFDIIGRQLGREVKFRTSYNGKVCISGTASINWFTEDGSFDVKPAEIDEEIARKLMDVYNDQLPGKLKG